MTDPSFNLTAGPTHTVSAVVCTHDELRWDALCRAVSSLKIQTRTVDEIIVVVDNNAALLARVEKELTGVIALGNRNTRGLSGARNTAAQIAGGSLVAFLDDDAAAAADWIERLAGECRDDNVLGAGGRVLPRWLDTRPSWFPDEFLWVVGCSYRGLPIRPAEVRNLYGGCFCIRRSVLEEVGGFRSELGRVGSDGMGCEETELCIRATRRLPGTSFRYDPRAVIEHDVPGDRSTWSYFTSRCFAEGVSKARLTRLVGTRSGLASERVHALRTLPFGVLRELGLAIIRLEPGRAGRGAAISAGLVITASGYIIESRSRKRGGVVQM